MRSLIYIKNEQDYDSAPKFSSKGQVLKAAPDTCVFNQQLNTVVPCKLNQMIIYTPLISATLTA